MDSIESFINSWPAKHTMVPISHQDISELENKLTIALPSAYKYLLTNYGLVHTPNVLTQTCDLTVNINNVHDFLSLDDIYELSKLYEMSGMPTGYILFSSDSQGNMFCFKLTDCMQPASDIPVWFYDRCLGTLSQVSQTFTAWLNEFLG